MAISSNISSADTPEKFAKAMEDFELITFKTINFVIKVIASQLFEDVIRQTPKLTGRARNNWVFSAGKTKEYRDVGPTDQKVLKTYKFDISGDKAVKKVENGLRRSPVMINKKKATGIEYYLTNQVPYVNKLEYESWSKQAIGGMARKNVQKYSKISLSHISKKRGKL